MNIINTLKQLFKGKTPVSGELGLHLQRLNKLLKLLKQQHKPQQLDWYWVLGAANSGKSSLLQQAGTALEPASEQPGAAQPNLYRHERSVFLELPGAYASTQAMLIPRLMRWFKQKRLLAACKGIIVTVSLADLATQKPEAFYLQIHLIRQALAHLLQRQDALPIYLLLTKADSIAGFTEFFEDLGYEERAQSLGIRLPTVVASQITPLACEQFNTLLQRLSARALWRIQQEHDSHRRVLIQNYPLQLAALKEQFSYLVYNLASLQLEQAGCHLTGIYFCSTDQQGIPVDCLLKAVPASMGLPMVLPSIPPIKQSYFIDAGLQGILKPVLPGERAINDRHLRNLRHRLPLYVVMLTSLILLSAFIYRHGQQQVKQLATTEQQLAAHLTTSSLVSQTSLVQLIEQLSALQETLRLLQQAQPPRWLVIVKPRARAWQADIKTALANLQALITVLQPLSSLPATQAQFADHKAYELAAHIINSPQDNLLKNLLDIGQTLPAALHQQLNTLTLQAWEFLLESAQNYLARIWQQQVIPEYKTNLDRRYPLVKSSSIDVPLNSFKHFFSSQGSLDNFFNTQLKPFVDTTHPQWQWRTAYGKSLALPISVLWQFERAHIIAKMFFDNNDYQVGFTLTPMVLGPNVKQLELTFNGQLLKTSAQNMASQHFYWPGKLGDTSPRLILNFIDNQNHSTKFSMSGPWAWFRLLDKANLHSQANNQEFQLVFDVNGKAAKYKLTADRPINPFIPNIIEQFRLPAINPAK